VPTPRRRRPRRPARSAPAPETYAWAREPRFDIAARIPSHSVGGEWVRWIGGLVIAAGLGWFALDNKTAVLIERVDQHYRSFDWRLQQIENAMRLSR
jgi:hypothetical protein